MSALHVALAGVAVTAAVGLALTGQPTLQDHLRARDAELTQKLASRALHLDPAEVNVLLHDAQSRVQLIDVRSEADFNLFHLKDARRMTLAELERDEGRPTFDPKALKIFIGAGEAEAEAAWRLATAGGTRDAYILAGGVDLWLAIYRDGQVDAQPSPPAPDGLASLTVALGDRLPYALPSAEAAHGRQFQEKAKRLTKAAKPAGGCGS
jgi:rhodanese-related sulfurtransferase